MNTTPTSNTQETDANVAWNAERYHLINMCDAHIARSLEKRLKAALAEVENYKKQAELYSKDTHTVMSQRDTLQQENAALREVVRITELYGSNSPEFDEAIKSVSTTKGMN